ncbi:MAG: mechanosensitive ion channel family protein [Thermoplasmatota archaeon]
MNHSDNSTLLPDGGGGFLGLEGWALQLFWTAATILIGLGLLKLFRNAVDRSAKRLAKLRKLDEYQSKVAVGRTKPMKMTVSLLMAVIIAIALLGIWDLDKAFTGLLAGAGFAGIVIGMAAGDTIGDVIAGFLIFYNNPFEIGDWVEINGIQGIVEDVALGATTIITFDNEKVTIPNRLVEGQEIKNFSTQRKLRRRIVVGVEYGSNLKEAREILWSIAMKHPNTLNDVEPMVVNLGFGASSVDLEVRYWVEPTRQGVMKTQTEIIDQIHEQFRAAGINIAFPHMQIVQPKPWQIEN